MLLKKLNKHKHAIKTAITRHSNITKKLGQDTVKERSHDRRVYGY